MDRKELLINRLREKGYKHIESDVYDISQRIKEYDEDLILFFNPKRQRYEIHSHAFVFKPTYCVSADTLDVRLLDKLRMSDNRNYGMKEKIKDVEEDYIKKELQREKNTELMQKDTLGDVKQRLKMKQHFHMGGD